MCGQTRTSFASSLATAKAASDAAAEKRAAEVLFSKQQDNAFDKAVGAAVKLAKNKQSATSVEIADSFATIVSERGAVPLADLDADELRRIVSYIDDTIRTVAGK